VSSVVEMHGKRCAHARRSKLNVTVRRASIYEREGWLRRYAPEVVSVIHGRAVR